MSGSAQDWSDSGQCQVIGPYEYSNEPLNTINTENPLVTIIISD
jgi:hypothetical protein